MCARETNFCNKNRRDAASFAPPSPTQKLPSGLATCFLNITEPVSCVKLLSLAEQIKEMLPPPPPMTEVKASMSTCVLPLSLERLNQQTLSLDLSKHGVRGVDQDSLVEIFIMYLKKLRRVYETQYENVVITWQQENLYEEAYDQAFRNLLEHLFSIRSRKMWYILLKEVSKYTQRCSSPPGPHSDDASDEGVPLKTGRGHDSEAVRILEQAFKHSPNITPAEKFRLSEVTGLKPKQVTIWVSA